MFLKANYLNLHKISRLFAVPRITTLSKHIKFYSVITNKDKNKKEIKFIKPKNYADVNSSRDKEYYEFEKMNLVTG